MRPRFTDVRLDREHWVVEGLAYNDDGTPHTNSEGQQYRRRLVFPADTLEWRAAEYGIDPADTATLLDIAIAEHFLTEQDWAEGAHLHSAPDVETARADHIARCAKAKLRHRIATRTAGHPFQRIRDESPMHPEALDLKRQLVEQARAHAAHPAAPPDRIAVLRAAVERGPVS